MIGYALLALGAVAVAAVVAWRAERALHQRTRDRALQAEGNARQAARMRDAALADLAAERAAARELAAQVDAHGATARRVEAERAELQRSAAAAAARIDAAAHVDDPDDAAAMLNAAEGL